MEDCVTFRTRDRFGQQDDTHSSGSGPSSSRVPAPWPLHCQEADSLTDKCRYRHGALYVVDTCLYTGLDPVTDRTATFTLYFTTTSKRVL